MTENAPTSSTPQSETHRPLAGRTAIVTGSTSGIGAAIAASLAADGARVLITGRDVGRGTQVLEGIRSNGGRAEFTEVDLNGAYIDLRTFAATATERLGGRVDILVNNAGIYPATSTEGLPDSDLDAMLAVNVRAPHVLVGALAPAMAERGSGSIVNIGSWMARTGNPFAGMYTATKAAIEQLTRAWSAEFGPSGVRVNTVSPGATLTPGNQDAEAVLGAMTATTPAGVVVRPRDIADAVAFVVSDRARMMHGVILDIDGGISSVRPAAP